jgi:FkbM family methyltransferase
MWTSPLGMKIRSLARNLGLNRVLAGALIGRKYEDRFGAALLAAIRPGDTVWDVGANVGVYTARFLEAAGPAGKVVAFEPAEACSRAIADRFDDDSRLTIMGVAVGDECGSITMAMEADELATTHRVIPAGAQATGPTRSVRIATGASICEEFPGLFPNVVKIDVEGHEGSAVRGMQPMLADPRLRCIGIEVHFGLLDARGENGTPRRIEQALQAAGYAVAWADPSHIIATRHSRA